MLERVNKQDLQPSTIVLRKTAPTAVQVLLFTGSIYLPSRPDDKLNEQALAVVAEQPEGDYYCPLEVAIIAHFDSNQTMSVVELHERLHQLRELELHGPDERSQRAWFRLHNELLGYGLGLTWELTSATWCVSVLNDPQEHD
ncbi:hypothetical protein [Ktedonobacter robiniae]|uniref:Uncharacterized protein n=1 Tax=Ktedonobacter robiniae TaxID=2778365 RepID=A0ABQ3V210_9CHLR|nr:hypothetical protein [Ktedonobacter robiniae]GHO59186.1 hypothetical protein KSB_76610 [Ktedonobacter robiniae]